MLQGSRIRISPMQFSDIEEVVKIERRIFPSPWSIEIFEEQLNRTDCAFYFVVKVDDKIVGYAGIIFTGDEGHITNVAVNENYRRRKIGSALLLRLIEMAQDKRSRHLFLELRKSNKVALKFYEKFGFQILGLRRNYYSDTCLPVGTAGEDAVVMFVNNVSSANYQDRLQIIRDSIGFGEV